MSEKRKIGNLGEQEVVTYLKTKGYKILARNFLKPYGEVDIIAMKDDIVCFIEVKTRKNTRYGTPREAVNYYKQQRIIKASQAYMIENKLTDYLMRFDVAEVLVESRKINLIENAF